MSAANRSIGCATFITRRFLFDFVVADELIALIDCASASLCFPSLDNMPDAVPCVLGKIFPETPAFELSLILCFTTEFVSSQSDHRNVLG
jgi:hypothetical protein